MKTIEEIKQIIDKDGIVKLKIIKNFESAPDMGTMFGQDVEADGTYLTQSDSDINMENWKNGFVFIKNPLIFDIENNATEYKYELAKKYKAKKKALTKKLIKAGYDSIITYEDYRGSNHTSEIIVFDRSNIVWNNVMSFENFK